MTAKTPSTAAPTRPVRSLDGLAPPRAGPTRRAHRQRFPSPFEDQRRPGSHRPGDPARTGGKQAQASQPALVAPCSLDALPRSLKEALDRANGDRVRP